MAKRTALFYLIVAALWILLSDAAMPWLLPDLENFVFFSQIKGIFFVVFTTLLLYFFVDKLDNRQKRLAREYADLFENNPNAMWLSRESDGQITAANPSACALYGYREEDFKRQRVQNLVTEDDTYNLIGDRFQLHKRSDGSSFWVKCYTSTAFVNNENLQVHTITNANDTIRAEADRIQAQRRLTTLIEGIDDYIFGLDLAGNFTYSNTSIERKLGFEAGGMVGQNALMRLEKAFDLDWRTLLNRQGPQKNMVEVMDAQNMAWYRLSIYHTELGSGVYMSNISSTKALEQAVNRYENTLKAITNASSDWIWAFDPAFRVLVANQTFVTEVKKHTGYEVITGKSLLPTDPTNQPALLPWLEAYQKALAGEKYHSILVVEQTQGGKLYMDVNLYPIVNAQGEVICVGCFAHDVTRRLEHEKQIENQNQQLLDIAWTQSHELRAPLANILGITQLLEARHQLSPSEQEELLVRLQESAVQLDAIIHRIVEKSARSLELH